MNSRPGQLSPETARRLALGLTIPPPASRNRRKHTEAICWLVFLSGWGLCAGSWMAFVSLF